MFTSCVLDVGEWTRDNGSTALRGGGARAGGGAAPLPPPPLTMYGGVQAPPPSSPLTLYGGVVVGSLVLDVVKEGAVDGGRARQRRSRRSRALAHSPPPPFCLLCFSGVGVVCEDCWCVREGE